MSLLKGQQRWIPQGSWGLYPKKNEEPMCFQQSPDLARSELKKRVGMMAMNRNEMPHDSHSTTGQS